MSFSVETKKELSSLKINSKIESLLELSSIARTNASMVFSGKGNFRLRFFSENPDVIGRVSDLIVYLYDENPDIITSQNGQLNKEPLYSLFLQGKALQDFLNQGAFDELGNYTESAERILSRLQSDVNAKAYLRGAFLGGGSIVDPSKSYHLEIVVPSQIDAKIILSVFHANGIKAKESQRRDQYLIYLKDSEMISDCLVFLGANKAMLELENVKAYKDLRNDINRQVNAETANMDKQLDASFRQIKAITYIEENGGLDQLPESLHEIALVRLEYPQVNLRQLGEALKPELSKSGVSHRLRKIEKFADELKERLG